MIPSRPLEPSRIVNIIVPESRGGGGRRGGGYAVLGRAASGAADEGSPVITSPYRGFSSAAEWWN